MEVMANFTERLRQLRDESGKTQSQIAKELGLTPQAFSYFVNGREPNYETLGKIADYFQVSVDYLLGRSDVKTADTTVRVICEYTGLIEEMVTLLNEDFEQSKNGGTSLFCEPINAFYRSKLFFSWVTNFLYYKGVVRLFTDDKTEKTAWMESEINSPEIKKMVSMLKNFNDMTGPGIYSLSGFDVMRFYEDRLIEIARRLLPEMAGFDYENKEAYEKVENVGKKWRKIESMVLDLESTGEERELWSKYEDVLEKESEMLKPKSWEE